MAVFFTCYADMGVRPIVRVVVWWLNLTRTGVPNCSGKVTEGFPVDPSSSVELVDNITKVTPFVLGMYLSLSVGRWWALRANALGAILDATSNVRPKPLARVPV